MKPLGEFDDVIEFVCRTLIENLLRCPEPLSAQVPEGPEQCPRREALRVCDAEKSFEMWPDGPSDLSPFSSAAREELPHSSVATVVLSDGVQIGRAHV